MGYATAQKFVLAGIQSYTRTGLKPLRNCPQSAARSAEFSIVSSINSCLCHDERSVMVDQIRKHSTTHEWRKIEINAVDENMIQQN
jgi:undecaprenyl pyrophosphate synthase